MPLCGDVALGTFGEVNAGLPYPLHSAVDANSRARPELRARRGYLTLQTCTHFSSTWDLTQLSYLEYLLARAHFFHLAGRRSLSLER
jgi:hypothetical protein